METFYSIIKLAPNPSGGDSLSNGLLLHDHSGFRLLFSENKKKAAKHLLYNNGGIVEFLTRQIEQKIQELNEELNHNEFKLINIPNLINSEYFSYLSNYCNGVLQFSKPTLIYDQMNSEKFNKLFEILIDRLPVDKIENDEIERIKFTQTIESKLISRIKDKVHTHLKLDNKAIESMYYQFEIDCIGLNGALVGAKSLQFSMSSHTLDTQISHYTNLITLLSLSRNLPLRNNNFFIIADEPDLNSPEHNIWVSIQKQPTFKVINSEQSDSVAQIIEDTDATKFLDV